MFSRFVLSVFIAILLVSSTGFAADGKIGVIDLQRALSESSEGKRVLEKLKQKLEKAGDQIKQQEDELKKLGEEIDKQALMLSEAARMEKEEKFRRLRREIDRFREDTKNDFLMERNKVTSDIYKDLMDIIKVFAEKEGYQIIMEAGEKTTGLPGGVIYFSNSIDITNQAIKIYDEKKKK